MSTHYSSEMESLFSLNHDLEIRQRKHSFICSAIFRNDSWSAIAYSHGLNPALIGQGLHALYHNVSVGETMTTYLALSTGDKSGDIRFHREAFFDSLKEPHSFDSNTNEVIFREPNITLNVEDAIENPEFISLEPTRLLSFHPWGSSSTILYLKDSRYAIRQIEPEDIVGIGGVAPNFQNAAYVCGMTLTQPENTKPRKQRFQQCFRDSRCGPISPISPNGYKFNGDNCVGWEWK